MENRESEKFSCPGAIYCQEPEKMPCYKVGKRILTNVWKWWEIEPFLMEECSELDHSSITVKVVVEKIRAFLKENHDELEYESFLRLLVFYPVSMCKREVSPRLKTTIGLLYHSTQNKTNPDNIDAKYSFDDLARLFVRSKATIKVCVDDTLALWYQIKRKAALPGPNGEQNSQRNAQTNEQPSDTPEGI